MPAYAAAHLRSVDVNDEIAEYINKIDATLPSYGGRFLVHGVQPEVVDGEFPGMMVIIEFPDLDSARAWYRSAEYQAILPLRTRNSDGAAFLLNGVPPGYRAADFLKN